MPVEAILILQIAFIAYARVIPKRSGHSHLLPIPIGLILGFVMWFLLFSALGDAEGRGMLRTLAWSVGTGIAMSAIWGWQLSRKKLK
jgi:hypothetical protein